MDINFQELINENALLIWQFFMDKVLFLILLFVGLRIIRAVMDKLEKFLATKNVDRGIVGFTLSIAKYGLYGLLIIQVLVKIGFVEAASLAAILASVSFAIGLALQGSFANFAGGVLIILLRPFKVGDYIEGDSHSGTVEQITIFYTYLLTVDNKRIMIPNGALSNHSIVNYSAMKSRRVDLDFGVGYESSHELVVETIMKVINKHDLIISCPEPFVRLSSHGDSALVYTVRVWTKKENYWTVYFDLLEEVKKAFDENDISIPYPHIQIVN